MAKEKEKTLVEHMESGAKYAGSSTVLALALTNISVFLWPVIESIKLDVLAVLVFVINMLAIYLVKGIEIGK